MVTPTSIHSQDIPMRIDKNEENKSFEFQSAFTKVNFKNKIDQSAVMSSENKEVMNKLRLDIPPVDFDYALPIPSLSAENSLKKEDDLNEKCFPSNNRNKSSRMYTEEEVLLLLKYIIKEFASIMNKFCAIRQPSLINCLNLMNLNSLVALSMIAGDQNQIGGISSQGSNVAKKNNKLDSITSFANFQNCEITNLLIQNLQNNQGTLNGDESIDKIQKLSDWIDLDLPNLKSSSEMVNPSQSNKINSEKSELNLHKAGAIERRKTIKLYDSPIIQSEEFDD